MVRKAVEQRNIKGPKSQNTKYKLQTNYNFKITNYKQTRTFFNTFLLLSFN